MPRLMDITIATGTFHPEIGGPPRYLHRLAGDLIREGHGVRVLTFAEFEGPHEDDPCPVLRISRASRIPVRLARMAVAVLSRARSSDLLYINDHGLAPALANVLLGLPVAMKIVGDFAWEFSVRHGLYAGGIDEFQSSRPDARSRLVQGLQRFYARRSRRVIVPSRYLAGLVEGWGVGPRRIVVIPNAIRAEDYVIPPTCEAARARLGIDFPFLLTVARLTPWKGIDHLLDLVPSLPAPMRLVVVGEGPERERLEARAASLGVSERVLFVGRVPPSEVTVWMRAAEVFVLFTGYEGMSHVLLEALAAGTPVVASDKGGNPEVIRDGVDGILVPYPDPTHLRREVAALLADLPRRERLRKAAARRAADFSWPVLYERTLAVFRDTIGEHARSSRRGRPRGTQPVGSVRA
ncbi:MAG: glycosyltransferase family 4 protein [Planctomycetes bacterium]|nr:glycosyltransferase family 4 protein [Planctomycetota bacterium]